MTIYLPSLLDKFKDFVNGLKANWEDYVDHINNTTDAHGIDVIAEDLADHAAETAEDDVHGLAGKVVVESGSNENGYYVRWDDGTQICWNTVTPDRSIQTTEQSFEFPKPFIASPAPSVGHAWGVNATYQLSCGTMMLSTSSTHWRIAFTNTTTIGATNAMYLSAIGRWK